MISGDVAERSFKQARAIQMTQRPVDVVTQEIVEWQTFINGRQPECCVSRDGLQHECYRSCCSASKQSLLSRRVRICNQKHTLI